MFTSLTIRGSKGALLWGHQAAVAFTSWAIRKNEAGQWMLVGTIGRIDRFQARQTPLLFTAPHEKGRDGFWAWAVEGDMQIGEGRLTARLGPPEQ